MKEIVMRRKGSSLVAVSEIDADELALIPSDQDVFVTARTRRNPRAHRLAWALADKLADACDFLHDRDDAMHYLKIKCRHVHFIIDRDGNTITVPRSISFASMTQQAFSRFLNRAVFVICNEILPGLAESDLRREIEEMVSGNEGKRRAA